MWDPKCQSKLLAIFKNSNTSRSQIWAIDSSRMLRYFWKTVNNFYLHLWTSMGLFIKIWTVYRLILFVKLKMDMGSNLSTWFFMDLENIRCIQCKWLGFHVIPARPLFSFFFSIVGLKKWIRIICYLQELKHYHGIKFEPSILHGSRDISQKRRPINLLFWTFVGPS